MRYSISAEWRTSRRGMGWRYTAPRFLARAQITRSFKWMTAHMLGTNISIWVQLWTSQVQGTLTLIFTLSRNPARIQPRRTILGAMANPAAMKMVWSSVAVGRRWASLEAQVSKVRTQSVMFLRDARFGHPNILWSTLRAPFLLPCFNAQLLHSSCPRYKRSSSDLIRACILTSLESCKSRPNRLIAERCIIIEFYQTPPSNLGRADAVQSRAGRRWLARRR